MSFSLRSSGSPYPVQGDPFENIMAYSENYIGLKRVFGFNSLQHRYHDLCTWQTKTTNILDKLLQRHLITATINTYLHLLTMYTNYLLILQLKQINAKYQFHFDDLLKDAVKPKTDEIIETTGASLQGDTGKVFILEIIKFLD